MIRGDPSNGKRKIGKLWTSWQNWMTVRRRSTRRACTNLSYPTVAPYLIPSCLESSLNLIKVARANIDPFVSQVHRYRGNYPRVWHTQGMWVSRHLNSFKLESFPVEEEFIEIETLKIKLISSSSLWMSRGRGGNVSRSTHERIEVWLVCRNKRINTVVINKFEMWNWIRVTESKSLRGLHDTDYIRKILCTDCSVYIRERERKRNSIFEYTTLKTRWVVCKIFRGKRRRRYFFLIGLFR